MILMLHNGYTNYDLIFLELIALNKKKQEDLPNGS